MHNTTKEIVYKINALLYTGNKRTLLHSKLMHYISQNTNALHYTGNTRITLHRKHMHYITQESLSYITKNICKIPTGYKRTALHRKYIHYITQETHVF